MRSFVVWLIEVSCDSKVGGDNEIRNYQVLDEFIAAIKINQNGGNIYE